MEEPIDPNLTILADQPSLRQPILVAAFAGWPDAGEVATGSLRYLAAKLQARKVARIEPDEFYDFSTLRPLVVIEQGAVQSLRFPSNDFLGWVNETGDQDLLFLLATEPQLRWNKYIAILQQVIELYGVARVISFGSLFDAVPHTRAIKVSASTTDASLRDRLHAAGVPLSDYHGPTSIHSVFSLACQSNGIEATSLWAHCPQYVRATANPNACYALLSHFSGMIGLDINLRDLQSAGEQLDATLSKLLQENKEMAQFVRKLEEAYEGRSATKADASVEPGEVSAEDAAASTERILREVEEFLRRDQKSDNGQS